MAADLLERCPSGTPACKTEAADVTGARVTHEALRLKRAIPPSVSSARPWLVVHSGTPTSGLRVSMANGSLGALPVVLRQRGHAKTC